MKPQPLRRWIAWVLTGTVSFAVTAFTLIVFVANESVEQQYHQRLVQTQRALVLHEFHETGQRQFDDGMTQSYLVDPQSGRPRPPDWLAAYPLGHHEEEHLTERDYYISVQDLQPGRLYIAVDITEPESEEAVFDLTILVSATLLIGLSIQMSGWLSRRLAGPLIRLASDVSRFDPAQRGQQVAAHAETAETLRIAEVFNAYSKRLDEFIEREQNLAAMASHELRTPLAAVSGAAEILEQRLADDAPNLKTVRRIREAVGEMRGSVEGILELVRRTGDGASHSCAAHELLADLAARQSAACAARGLRLALDSQPVILAAHPQLVSSLFSNLLNNALRHTEQGEVLLQLDTQGFSVSDTGSGFAPTDLPRLMQPGARGRHNDQLGSGLGLYIARKVCERYGWMLHLSNREGGGAEAQVRFTRVPDERPLAG